MNRDERYWEEISFRLFGQRINITYDLAQDILHSQVLPLQTLILVKIISDLWQESEVRNEIKYFVMSTPETLSQNCRNVLWISVEEKVRSKIKLLRIPSPACKDLSYRICHGIGCSIYEYVFDEHFVKIPKDLFAVNYSLTHQGTVNKMKTLLLILERLTEPALRYEVACFYFIEDHVRINYDNLPENLKFAYLYELDFSFHNFALAFWGWRISANVSILINITQLFRYNILNFIHVTLRDCLNALFDWEVVNNNEVAVQYLWKHILDEEKKNSLVHLSAQILHSNRHRNIMCYFIGQMNTAQQVKLLKDNTHSILIRLLDWRWERVFVEAAKFTFKFLTNWDFSEILHTLAYYFCNQHQYFSEDQSCRKVIVDFLISSPLKSRESVIKNFPTKYWDMMSNLTKTNVPEIINIFSNFTQPLDLVYSSSSITMCERFIEETDYKSLGLFLKNNLVLHEQLIDFKKHFIQRRGYEMCTRFLTHEKWEEIDMFMNWCSFTDEEIINFKEYLPYVNKGKIINSIISSLEENYDEKTNLIDGILYWCFSDNLSLIRFCKKRVLLNNSDFYYCNDLLKRKCVFYSEAKKLMIRRKWKVLNKCFNWCHANKEEIQAFTNNILSDAKFIIKLVKLDFSLELLDSILIFCKASDLMIYQIKNTIIDNQTFFVNLLSELNFEAANSVLNWCVESSKQKRLFKNHLTTYALRSLLSNVSNENNLKKLLDWFDPTSDIISVLIRTLQTWYKPKKEYSNFQITKLIQHLEALQNP